MILSVSLYDYVYFIPTSLLQTPVVVLVLERRLSQDMVKDGCTRGFSKPFISAAIYLKANGLVMLDHLLMDGLDDGDKIDSGQGGRWV